MKLCLTSVLCICFSVSLLQIVQGRSVTKEGLSHIDPSRTLKGVLKFYKEQSKPETDSLEAENDATKEVTDIKKPESYHLDLQVTKDEGDLITKPLKIHKTSLKSSSKIKSIMDKKSSDTNGNNIIEDNREMTTILPLEQSDDGSGVSFVSAEQLANRSDLDADDIDLDLDGCSEGDVTRVSCNTCVCSDSKYFCSKRDCHEAEKPLPPVQKSSSKRKGIIKYHKPSSDSSTKNETISESIENVGNVSVSFEDNSPVLLSQCIDGRTKPVDCNQCVCAMGQWACTKMSCIALTLREKASYSGHEFLKSVGTLKEYMNIDEDCMEGDAKKMGCNQCVCHRNSWACSTFECPSTIRPVKVEAIAETCQTEEDVKSKDCNICSCRRGLWVCTNNDCKQFGNRYFNPVSHQKHGSANSDEADQEI